jgi:serine/threonine-protein kinase
MDAPKEPIKEPTPAEPEGAATFEKVVVEKGWATPEQVEAAVKHRAEKKAQGELISLSQALVSLGTITPAQAREALGAQEKMSMRCPTCRKVFNVWGKPGARTLCRTCKVALVPTGASFVTASETSTAPAATPTATATAPAAASASPTAPAPVPTPVPAADAVDATLASLIPGYRIVRRLGSGGMGDVFQAQQISLDRPVALKLLPVELAKDKVFVERFLSEARAAGKVAHENIVAAVDVGEANGRYYFVMELVEGPTLQQVISREGALPEDRALETARQIARGLRHAHQQNLIHRDIKPANIMIAAGNVAKICDFGLARRLDEDTTLTMPGMVQSSPAYASPEQCRGRRDLDHRTDMYSLGVALFEMLTGKRPFQGDTPGALFIKHATEAPPSPQSINPSVSPAATQLVLRLLKKEPKQRFDTYDQLIQAIEAVQKPKAPGPAMAKSAPRPSTVRRVAIPKRNPVLLGSAAALLVLGAAGFLFFRTPAGSAIKKASTTEPVAKSKPAAESEADRVLAEMSAQELRAEDVPTEIPAVRGRWKELAEKYRGTPTFPVVTRRQSAFEARVSAMAEALAVQTLSEAQNRRQAGRPAEAFLLLRGFPSLYEGTEAASRIAAIAEETGKAIEETFMAEREKVLAQLAAGKADEAARALGPLKALVSGAAADGTVDFIRADFREHVDKLTARIEAVSKPSQPKPDNSGGGGKSESQALPTAKTIERGPVASPEFVQVLRSADLRANPRERARAAAAFGSLASRSAVCRAVEVYLAHDDKFWKLAPGTRQFGEYLASLPLERADTLSSAEHVGFFVGLAKKMSEPGDAPKDLLALFALAHVDDLLAQNVRPDPEGIRMSKFQSAKTLDFWGPAATVNRLALARVLASGGSPVDLKRAIEAASTSVDFPTKYMTALAAFREPEFDPTAGVATWKRLAAWAPESPAGKYCDGVAERIKKALPCESCSGQGKYACKKCQAQGMADCDRCKGTGRVKENPDSNFTFGYTVPCPVCKQKGKLLCPLCQGGKVQKCEKCDGKKVKKTMTSGDFADVLSASGCAACGGTGSVFPRTAYPCPDCDGFGRFPTNAGGVAPGKGPEAAAARVTPAAAAPESPAVEAGDVQRGLIMQGYLGEKFEKLVYTQVSPAIDFQCNTNNGQPPAWSGGPSEHFSVRWTGWIRIQEPGKYFFKAMSDDGVRLFIDDVQIFEDWDPHAPRQAAAMADLTKGQHKIRVDYYNAGLSGTMTLSWQPPSASAPVVIPPDAFRCPKK